ncbi:hypothetical protein L6R49_05090 [Myxococcota bacterium]|nr:hypothetical protein [Myxococcota bacterium]
MSRLLLAVGFVSAFVACDRDSKQYFPQPVDEYPGVVDLGNFTPLTASEWLDPAARTDKSIYAGLGENANPGQWGGATFTFQGTGGTVCVIVDPEAVFWNTSVDVRSPADGYICEDNNYDDGDLDLEVGLSAYYNGTPGVSIGNFEQVYEDSLGNEVVFEANECQMIGFRGQAGAHAGRATPEFCAIDTSLHPGRDYTVLLRLWSVPADDFVVHYAASVVEIDGDDCSDAISAVAADPECVLQNEGTGEGFGALEELYCNGELDTLCTEPE